MPQYLSDKLDDTLARFVERINVATDRMFTMIDGVLAYSTANAVNQKSESVDLNKVIADIREDIEVALQTTGAV